MGCVGRAGRHALGNWGCAASAEGRSCYQDWPWYFPVADALFKSHYVPTPGDSPLDRPAGAAAAATTLPPLEVRAIHFFFDMFLL